MNRAEIIAHLVAALDFPSNRKALAIAIDVPVLREAVRELKAAGAVTTDLGTFRLGGGE